MNILICFGTRPEWIKIKPLLSALREVGIPFTTLKVKQHTTLLQDIPSDYEVEVAQDVPNRLDGLVASLGKVPLGAFSTCTHILVQGDTATAFLCALAGFHRNIPVIHLEAGLRTYDTQNPYPEETYRQLISRIATIHLCPTQGNAANLEGERASGIIEVVGNTVLDNLNYLKATSSLGDEVLVTLHRRENHPHMDRWFRAVSELALTNPHLKFTLPLHPNPNVQKHKDFLVGVNVVEPIPHDQFLERLNQCYMVITDSGGIQEEGAFLGKRVLVCREVTERPESVRETSWMVHTPEELEEVFGVAKEVDVKPSMVYGDGASSIRIARFLNSLDKNS